MIWVYLQILYHWIDQWFAFCPCGVSWQARTLLVVDYLAFQLATVMPSIAKSMRPDNPNKKREILRLISLGNTPPSPRTRKFAPRVITTHRPIFSLIFDECFRLGVVKTSLMGFKPNNCSNCLLKIPNKIMTLPMINQKGNIVWSPIVLVPNPPRQRTVTKAGVNLAWEQNSIRPLHTLKLLTYQCA